MYTKNAVSHRRKALTLLGEYLKENGYANTHKVEENGNEPLLKKQKLCDDHV